MILCLMRTFYFGTPFAIINQAKGGAIFMQKTIRTNKLIFLIQSSLIVICSLLSTGTLLQTLLVTLGFSTKLIYIHSTAIQAVNVAALLLFTKTAGEHNLIKKYALTGLPSGVLLLCYLPFCFRSNVSWKAFGLLVLIGIFQAVVNALRTGYSYTLPYLLYPAGDYGPMTAVSGIVSGAISFAMGYALSVLTKSIPYVILMAGAFGISALLEFISIRLTLMQKSILDNGIYREKPVEEKTPSISETLKHPAFSRLILPNTLRGFAYGMTIVLATLAFELGFDETVTTAMVSISAIASLIGCAMFGILLKKVSSRHLVFMGSMGLLLLPLLFTKNKVMFLIIYALVLFGRTLVDNGVPTLLRYIVPLEIAGPYNVLRMLLHSGGSLIATFVAAMVSPEVLILLTVAASVISGVIYLRKTGSIIS